MGPNNQEPVSIPPEWIIQNQAIYDGDIITLKSSSWNGLILKMEGNRIRGKRQGSPITDRVNPFTFVIRKMKMDAKLNAYVLKVSALTKKNREPIGWGEDNPFILIPTTSTHLCLRTEFPKQWALGTTNSNEGIFALEFPYVTKEAAAKCSTTLLNIPATGCINKYTQGCALWYFHRANGSFGPPFPYYGRTHFGATRDEINRNAMVSSGLLIRSLYGKIFESPLYNGGRNLTIGAGSNGEDVKTSGHNNDTDDKSVWFVGTWNVRGGVNYSVPETPRYSDSGAFIYCPPDKRPTAAGGCEPVSPANQKELNNYIKCRYAVFMNQQGLGTNRGKYLSEYDAESDRWKIAGSGKVPDDGAADPNRIIDDTVAKRLKEQYPGNFLEWLFYIVTGEHWANIGWTNQMAIKGVSILLAAVILVTIGKNVADNLTGGKASAMATPPQIQAMQALLNEE